MPRIESEMLQPGWWGGESGEKEVRKGSYEYKICRSWRPPPLCSFFPFAPLESTVHGLGLSTESAHFQ